MPGFQAMTLLLKLWYSLLIRKTCAKSTKILIVMDNSDDKNKGSSQDDQNIWDRFVRDIEQISDKKHSPKGKIEIKPKEQPENFAEMLDQPLKPAENISKPHEKIEFQDKKAPLTPKNVDFQDFNIALDRKSEERLRKGQIVIEAQIDLHGLSQNDAYDALMAFITRKRAQGLRNLLIITGKGKAKSSQHHWFFGHRSVLREAVPQWLSEGTMRNIVLRYTHAHRKDGGTGAYYVILRK